MLTLTVIVHLIVSLLLVILVLLQDSKGGAMGVLSGGGSGSVLGSGGADNLLTKATRYLAIIFAITCLSLAYQTSTGGSSVIDKAPSAAGAIGTEQVETIDTTKALDEGEGEAAEDAAQTQGSQNKEATPKGEAGMEATSPTEAPTE